MSAIAEANSTVSWFARADRTLNSRPDALEVAVEVSGTRATEAAAARELFSESTHTTLVFADGAVVRLSAAVAVGQLLFVRHERSQRELVTRVLRQRRISTSSAYVELEFTEPAPDFWTEDLTLAAAGGGGENALTSSAIGQPGSLPAQPVRAEAQDNDAMEMPLIGDEAAESYELLNDGGAQAKPTEAGAQDTHGADYEAAGNHTAQSQPLEEEALAPSFAKPDESEVARLRAELDAMRAQMTAVLEQTHATGKSQAANPAPEQSGESAQETTPVETAKLSEDLAQMFAGIPSAAHAEPNAEASPVPAATPAPPAAATKPTFAPPIVTNPAVTPEEFARELERLNRARKQGISVEELEEETPEAATQMDEEEAAIRAVEAPTEDAQGDLGVKGSRAKRTAAVAFPDAAASGSANTTRLALIAALLLVALLGGVAYWKGWIGAGRAASGNVNAAVAPRVGGGVLRPVAKKTTDAANAEAAAASHDATADATKAAGGADAAAVKDADPAGEDASAQKPARSNGPFQAAAKFLRGAVRGNEAAVTPVSAEESGEGYEPPKVVKAVNAVPPPEAVQNFVTGDVKFNALIDASGKVASADVLSGPEPLRAAALEALKKYQYKAATKNGQPVAGHVVVAVKFWYEP